MKISTHSILITFIIVFFVSALFLVASPPEMQQLPDNFRAGQVLGVSEAMANRSFTSLGYELPKNNFRPNLPPEKTDKSKDFNFNNCGGAILDSRTGTLLYSQDADRVMPIASISKLASALVFMDTKPNWEAIYKVKSSDIVGGGKDYIAAGDEVRVRDLFYLGLVGSINSSIEALVSSTGISHDDFVKKMNAKAKELGLKKTNFVEPTGLSDLNVSTPAEVAKLADVAFKNKYIQETSLTENYEFSTLKGKKISIDSTDALLGNFSRNDIKLIGGKTGFTNPAGYCFVGKFTDADGNAVVSAVLGGQTISSRFDETKSAINWVYDSFKWKN